MSKISRERKNLQAKLDALKPYDIDMDEKQSSELLRVVTAISKNANAVEQLCVEADKVLGSENNVLREVWQQDVTDRIRFEADQSAALTGNLGNRWSQITVRIIRFICLCDLKSAFFSTGCVYKEPSCIRGAQLHTRH